MRLGIFLKMVIGSMGFLFCDCHIISFAHFLLVVFHSFESIYRGVLYIFWILPFINYCKLQTSIPSLCLVLNFWFNIFKLPILTIFFLMNSTFVSRFFFKTISYTGIIIDSPVLLLVLFPCVHQNRVWILRAQLTLALHPMC